MKIELCNLGEKLAKAATHKNGILKENNDALPIPLFSMDLIEVTARYRASNASPAVAF